VARASGRIGTPQTLNVTYNITGVKITAANLNYQIADTITSDDLERTFSITGYPTSQSWTATSNVPWLAVVNGSAAAATTITASLLDRRHI
jgi:hypothetical protein